MSITTGRCTGHCCRSFRVSGFNGLKGLDEEERLTWLARRDLKDDPEAVRTLRMLVPVEDGEDEHGTYTMFTCRNFDTETGNCRVYASRPNMCRGYPRNEGCSYEGCTLGC